MRKYSILVLSTLSFLFLVACSAETDLKNSTGPSLEGVALLQDMETRDVAEAETAIQKKIDYIAKQKELEEAARIEESKRAEEEKTAEEIKNLNFKDIFKDCIVMGDSITEGFSYYNMLKSSQIICKSGISLPSTKEHFEIARSRNPKYVFLSYGSNDISHDHYDYERFEKHFRSMLDNATQMLPNAKLYVNSIFPAREPLTKKQPWYKETEKYNQVMKKVCDEYGIPFLDNGEIIREEYYSSDGYHFISNMYPFWMYRMARAAGIL